MKLDQYKNKHGKVWVNVASSIYVVEDFVNLDNHPFLRLISFFDLMKFVIPVKYHEMFKALKDAKSSAILVRHDCRKKIFFTDESVDHILCSHFIEHVFPKEADQILKDFFRVLKPGATCHLIVPDLNLLVRQYIDEFNEGQSDAGDRLIRKTILSRDDRGSLIYRLLEFTGAFGLQHLWMYDSSSLASRVENVGFKLINVNETPSKNYRLGDESLHLIFEKPPS